ncbi:phasin family protein [Paenibacillus marinisediminis]
MSIQDDMKKVLLVGIGAVATTAEKSMELVDTFLKKGQITLDQAKVLNEELKRTAGTKPAADSSVNVLDKLNAMSKDELAALKAKLAEMENMEHEAEASEQKQYETE